MNEKDENEKDLFNSFLQKIWRRLTHILKAGFPDESPESESVQTGKETVVSNSRSGLKKSVSGNESFTVDPGKNAEQNIITPDLTGRDPVDEVSSGKESMEPFLPEEEAEINPDRIREKEQESSRQEFVSDEPELLSHTGSEINSARQNGTVFPTGKRLFRNNSRNMISFSGSGNEFSFSEPGVNTQKIVPEKEVFTVKPKEMIHTGVFSSGPLVEPGRIADGFSLSGPLVESGRIADGFSLSGPDHSTNSRDKTDVDFSSTPKTAVLSADPYGKSGKSGKNLLNMTLYEKSFPPVGSVDPAMSPQGGETPDLLSDDVKNISVDSGGVDRESHILSDRIVFPGAPGRRLAPSGKEPLDRNRILLHPEETFLMDRVLYDTDFQDPAEGPEEKSFPAFTDQEPGSRVSPDVIRIKSGNVLKQREEPRSAAPDESSVPERRTAADKESVLLRKEKGMKNIPGEKIRNMFKSVSMPDRWKNEDDAPRPFSLSGSFLQDPARAAVISIPDFAVGSAETTVSAVGNSGTETAENRGTVRGKGISFPSAELKESFSVSGSMESFSAPSVSRGSVSRIPSEERPAFVQKTVTAEEQPGGREKEERSLYEQALAKLISPQEKQYVSGEMAPSGRSLRTGEEAFLSGTGEARIGESGSFTQFPFHFSAEMSSVQDLFHTGSLAGEFLREKSVHSGETLFAGMDGKKSADLLAEKMKESVKLLNNINSSCENLKQIVTEGMNI